MSNRRLLCAVMILISVVSLFSCQKSETGESDAGLSADTAVETSQNELDNDAVYKKICESTYNVMKVYDDMYGYYFEAYEAAEKLFENAELSNTEPSAEQIKEVEEKCKKSYDGLMGLTVAENPAISDSTIYEFMNAHSMLTEDYDSKFYLQQNTIYYSAQSILCLIGHLADYSSNLTDRDVLEHYIDFNTKFTTINLKVDTLGFNHFFCPTEGDTESVFRRDYYPKITNMKYELLDLKWLSSQSELENQGNALLSSAEELYDDYYDYLNDVEYMLTQGNAELRQKLMELYGISEEEAQNMIDDFVVKRNESDAELMELLG